MKDLSARLVSTDMMSFIVDSWACTFRFERVTLLICMGEIFQDYSSIEDFEADFPKEVSLKILN